MIYVRLLHPQTGTSRWRPHLMTGVYNRPHTWHLIVHSCGDEWMGSALLGIIFEESLRILAPNHASTSSGGRRRNDYLQTILRHKPIPKLPL